MSKFLEALSLPIAFSMQERGITLAGASSMSSAFWDWERLIMQVLFLFLLIRIALRLGKILNRADRLDEQAKLDRVARETAIKHLTDTAEGLKVQTEEIALQYKERKS